LEAIIPEAYRLLAYFDHNISGRRQKKGGFFAMSGIVGGGLKGDDKVI